MSNTKYQIFNFFFTYLHHNEYLFSILNVQRLKSCGKVHKFPKKNVAVFEKQISSLFF